MEKMEGSEKKDELQLKKRAVVIEIYFHLDGRAEAFSEERDSVLM